MILPPPSDTFAWTETPAGPALVCRPLERFAAHVFTTRSWLLGSPAVDEADRWGEVAKAVGTDPARLLRVHQVHGADVVIHRVGSPLGRPADADIILTDDRSTGLAIQTADCVPLLLADSRTGAVAAAHAGWRGMAQRVPLVAVEAMANAFGSRESKLVAAIGPSIGACCYAVGHEVRDRFAAAGFSEWELSRWFTTEARSSPGNPPLARLTLRAREGHWFLDMWTAARDQLRSAGVREDRIFVAELCTTSHPDTLCSYRRDGAPAGRMAAAIRKVEG
jgi:YfiH family protein